jgi:hypothetical protein
MLKIASPFMLQTKARGVATRYAYAKRKGDLATLCVTNRNGAILYSLILTQTAVRRLEFLLRMLRAVNRDFEIGIMRKAKWTKKQLSTKRR